ncbi:hypothetical protein Taro_019964 [Colocasia esculenta]|uniref:Uncharacterized protein n=1 Tax=Colocasia esculenta TaxID=4460 RepID=A0A843UV01_COLES|nr:hypothetical protein [Colocasia esculenta]
MACIGCFRGHGWYVGVCSRLLLLWLVRDWLSLLSLVRKAHPPTLFRHPTAGFVSYSLVPSVVAL